MLTVVVWVGLPRTVYAFVSDVSIPSRNPNITRVYIFRTQHRWCNNLMTSCAASFSYQQYPKASADSPICDVVDRLIDRKGKPRLGLPLVVARVTSLQFRRILASEHILIKRAPPWVGTRKRFGERGKTKVTKE